MKPFILAALLCAAAPAARADDNAPPEKTEPVVALTANELQALLAETARQATIAEANRAASSAQRLAAITEKINKALSPARADQ